MREESGAHLTEVDLVGVVEARAASRHHGNDISGEVYASRIGNVFMVLQIVMLKMFYFILRIIPKTLAIRNNECSEVGIYR